MSANYVIPAFNLEARRPAPISWDAARAEALSNSIADAPHASHNGGAEGVCAVARHGAIATASTNPEHPHIDAANPCDVGGCYAAQRTDEPAQTETAE